MSHIDWDKFERDVRGARGYQPRSGSERSYNPVCPRDPYGCHDFRFHAADLPVGCVHCGRMPPDHAVAQPATRLPDYYAAHPELPRRGTTYNDALHDTSDDGVMGLAMTALVVLGVAFGMGVATGVGMVWLWEHVL